MVATFGMVEVSGNSASDILFNFWIRSFSFGAANFTILYISELFCFIAVVPGTLLWYVCRSHETDRQLRPFFLNYKSVGSCIVCMALSDFGIDVFGTYAAGHVPVVLQVVLKAFEPVVCLGLSLVVFRQPTSVAAPQPVDDATHLLHAASVNSPKIVWVPPNRRPWTAVGAIVCTAAGAFIGARTAMEHSSEKQHATFWVAVFACRVFCSASYNVAQGKLMRDNVKYFPTHRLRFLLGLTTLAGDFTLTLLMMTLFGPLIDTIRVYGWGASSSYEAAWGNFRLGVQCVTSDSRCPNNGWYMLVINTLWVLVYVADFFLNEISPALNSALNMLSTPVTQLVLMVFPGWSLGEKSANFDNAGEVASQVVSVCCIVAGVALFFIYESKRTLPREEDAGADITPD